MRNWIQLHFYIYSYENQQKLLQPELLFVTPTCTKSFVCWGLAPDPTGDRAYSAPQGPDPWLYLEGPTSKGRGGDGEERRAG